MAKTGVLGRSPNAGGLRKLTQPTDSQNKIQPAATSPIPPFVTQRRMGAWPSVQVTIFWKSYTRKTPLEYWIN